MRVTNAMVHSLDDIDEVEVLEWNSDNDITVRTKQGVVCKAIFHPFVGRIYADDLYAVLDNYKESYREGCNTFNRKRKKLKTEAINDYPISISDELEDSLKELTSHYRANSGTVRTAYRDEKDRAKEILQKHYNIVEVSYDDRPFASNYVIVYASPKSRANESFNRKRKMLKEMLFFKPMSKEDAKKFYDLLKQEKPSPFIRNCLDNLTFFTDNFSKDYGNYDPKENYEKAPLPERFSARGVSEGTKKTNVKEIRTKPIDPKSLYQMIIDKNGNPSIQDFIKVGYTESEAVDNLIRMVGKQITAKTYVDAAKRMLKELTKDKSFNSERQDPKGVKEGLTEDIDFTSFKKELKDTIPEKDIDTHQSDLYLRVTPETTALIKKYGIDKSTMLSKFRDNIEHDMWYELPFVNMSEYIAGEKRELGESKKCSRKRKLKENRDYAKEDADKEKIMDWLLDNDKVQKMWDWFYATEDGNDEDEILSTLADEYIEANGGYSATDKTYRSFEGDDQFGLRDKETNDLLYSSEDSRDAWEDEPTRMGDRNRDYIKNLLKKVINLYAFYNFNRDDLEESKLPTRGKKKLKERWENTLNSGKSLRQAIKSGDSQEVLKKLKRAYDELERKDLISQSDLLDVMYEISDAEEEPSQERVDELLDNFYDFCDMNRIWVGM